MSTGGTQLLLQQNLKDFEQWLNEKKSSQLTGHEIEFSLTLKFFAA